MKILIIANSDIGLYQFRRELIAELLKSNEVYISLPKGNFIESLVHMGCRYLETHMERRGMNPLRDGKLLLTYCKLMRQIKPDLVIAYTIKPNIYGGFVARLTGIPYALNITGLGSAFQRHGILRRAVTVMYKISCKKAKVIFFENAENREIFLEEGIAEESKACLLNGAGVNLNHYQVANYPADDEIRFLFVGRIMKEKGVEELFDAMRKLVSEGVKCSLDMVGYFDDDCEEEIKQATEEGWLRFHGYQRDVRPFIASCHCFILPSWHEGMANTNLECAASGRPVITSNIHGCLEAVEDGVTGFLCEKKNAKDLQRAMKQFAALPRERRREMGLAGRRRMEELFDKKKVVEATCKELFK